MNVQTEDRVCCGAEESRYGEEMSSGDDVGKIKGRAEKCSGNEAELDGDGDPTHLGISEVPFSIEGGNDRGAAEPKRHAQQLCCREKC